MIGKEGLVCARTGRDQQSEFRLVDIARLMANWRLTGLPSGNIYARYSANLWISSVFPLIRIVVYLRLVFHPKYLFL